MPSENVIISVFLTGWQEFVAGARAASTSMKEMAVSTDESSAAMNAAGGRSFLMNQGLFTMRRLIYGTSLALIGAGALALKFGWSYTSAMQQASVALRPVLGQTGQLSDELDYLFRFSAFTPFQFKDITTAFRQMYAAFHPLGISVGTTNTTIKAMVDALSYAGRTTPGALNRVGVALQHMAYQGHLTGYTVNQLARDGIPIFAALSKVLGLTGDQLHKVGTLGISTGTALAAINKYIESTPGYMNSAFRQATQTLQGAFTTFKDLLSQAVGRSEGGLFSGIQHMLQNVDAALAPFYINKKPLTVYAIASAFDTALTPGTHLLINTFVFLQSILRGVLFEFKLLGDTITGMLYPLRLFGVLGGTSQRIASTLGYAVSVAVTAFIAWKIAAGLAATATELWTAVTKVAIAVSFLFSETLLLTTGRFAESTIATWIGVTAIDAWSIATGIATAITGAFTAAVDALTIAMYANPIGLIIAGVVLLVGGLVLLYFKWKAFHDLINNTFHWIESHWKLLAAILVLPFSVVAAAVIEYFGQIKRAATDLVRWIGNAFSFMGSELKRLWDHIPGHGFLSDVVGGLGHVVGLAGGGTLLSPGLTLVGEHGPELLHLPAGASVVPLQGMGGSANFANAINLNQNVRIYLDGQELTRSVAKIVTDKEARL